MGAKRNVRHRNVSSRKNVVKRTGGGPSLGERLFSLRPDVHGVIERVRFYCVLAAWLLLVVDVFLVSSLFTRWTGSLGTAAREGLFATFGGGVLILLLYVGYLCGSTILRKKVPRALRQTAGTVLLYLCSTLVLGLSEMSSGAAAKGGPLSLLSPGALGRWLASWSFENLGPIGTTLIGFVTISLTLLFYGFTAWLQPLFDRLVGAFSRDGSSERPASPEETTADAEETREDDGEPDDFPSDGLEAEKPGHDESDASFLETLPIATDVRTVDEIESEDGPAPSAGRFPPPVEIYGKEHDDGESISEEMARPWGERIIDSLEHFGIEADLAEILIGPTVIQFRIQPTPGVKVSKIAALSNDLAMALAVSSLRVEAPIPGKPYVGIEIPNPKRVGITLRSVIEEDEYQETEKTLPLPMGVTINGDPMVIGLEDLPHLLVAGTTGSGKSVFVNSCIVGLCSMRRPDELKMVLVDPKRVEMALYEKLPHILTPPVTDAKKAVHVLGWAIREMERRYGCFAELRVRNLASYNELVLPRDRLPHIVIVVDELADLMMTAPKEVEEYICRLAQMARATGIHLVLATQRPSVNVITGLIKANVPARVAFTLPSMMDSRTILDSSGAEKLLGKGDMLFLSTQYPKPIRVQSPWIDEHAITRWLDYLVGMFGEPVYTDIELQGDGPAGFEEAANFDDALLDEAVRVVVSTGMASASGLQRRLRIGFTRAGRLVDMMESAGIVGPADGSRPREILVDEEEAEAILESLRGSG